MQTEHQFVTKPQRKVNKKEFNEFEPSKKKSYEDKHDPYRKNKQFWKNYQ